MKKLHYLWFAAVVLTVLAGGCEDLLSDLLKFDTDYYALEFTIEPTDQTGERNFAGEVQDVDIDSLLARLGLTRDNIESATVSDGMAIMLTAGADFDALSSFEVWMETPDLGSEKLAWIDEVPPGADTLMLNLTGSDLTAYLQEDAFELMARGVLASPVESPLSVRTQVRFLVRGDLETGGS